MKIELYHGMIVKVGEVNVKDLSLPDWNLCYIEYPTDQMAEYRRALMQPRVRLVRVTNKRIYFEQG
jgi:hypothetical protein